MRRTLVGLWHLRAPLRVGAGLLLGLCGSAGAQSPEAEREADMFGSPEPATAAPAAAPSAQPPPASAVPEAVHAREAAMFGEPETAATPGAAMPGAGTPGAATGATDPEAAREAAMFGGDAPAETPRVTPLPEPAAALPVSAEHAHDVAGLAPREGADPSRDLRLADPLTVGGRLYLRSDLYVSENTDFADQRIDTPNLLDVYLDARPIDRVRAYARFRLTYDPAIPAAGSTVGGNTSGAVTSDNSGANTSLFSSSRQTWLVNQLWIKWDWGRTAWFTVGIQPVRWGTGHIFNPTDVLNRQRLNALTSFDFRGGVPLARLDLPIEAIGGSAQIMAELDSASSPGQVGAAARLQGVFGPVEASVSARVRKDRPLMLGADFSTALGPFDVYGELAMVHGGGARHWNGEYRLPSDADIDAGDLTAASALRFPTEERREDDWIPQAVFGIELPISLNDQDSITLGAEYFFNENGYSDANLYPWLVTSGDFQPFYLGRHYAAVFAVLANPGPLDATTFVLTALSNLSDGSAIARLNITHTVHRHLFLEPYVSVSAGQRGGEYRFAWTLTPKQAGWINDQAETFGGASAGLPEQGIQVNAPVLQTGLWLRVPI